jgi:Carbohydrate-selective porin, OprB family
VRAARDQADADFTLHSRQAVFRISNLAPGPATQPARMRKALSSSPLIEAANWNVHGQYTLVGQGYPSFNSPYEGPKSLAGSRQFQNTQSATAYVGVRLWESAEFYVNPELMQGFGLSDVSGVAGFPNGEAQKSNFPSPRLNVARAFLRQTFGLGGEQETINDGPNQLSGKQDISRITVTAGKFAVTDAFNGNAYEYRAAGLRSAARHRSRGAVKMHALFLEAVDLLLKKRGAPSIRELTRKAG